MVQLVTMPLRISDVLGSHLCPQMVNPRSSFTEALSRQASERYIGIGNDHFLSQLPKQLFIKHPTMYTEKYYKGTQSQ